MITENPYIKQFPDLMAGKTVLYVHGFASSGQSGTVRRLQEVLPEARVIAPDLPIHPHEALALLHDVCQQEKPDLIVGTSMGGMLGLYIDAPASVKLVINPSLEMERTLRQRGYGKHPYLQERENGEKEFTIDEPMIQRFVSFRKEQLIRLGTRNIGLFSTDDELLGHEMSKRNARVLADAGFDIVWSDKFGHRCNDNAVKQITKLLHE